MKEYIKKDLFRYEGMKCHSLKTQLRYLLVTPGFQYSWCLRHASNASYLLSQIMWKILLRMLMYMYGIQIPHTVKLGEGLRIGHWGTIIVNPNCVIGKNFSIGPGCLIGSAKGKRSGVPTIGDNVILTANCMIVGGVEIGDDVLIGPGAFVNFNVPKNSIVIGNPGKIINRDASPTRPYNVYPIEDYRN